MTNKRKNFYINEKKALYKSVYKNKLSNVIYCTNKSVDFAAEMVV